MPLLRHCFAIANAIANALTKAIQKSIYVVNGLQNALDFHKKTCHIEYTENNDTIDAVKKNQKTIKHRWFSNMNTYYYLVILHDIGSGCSYPVHVVVIGSCCLT